MTPTDLAAAQLLPDDTVVVVHAASGAPLWTGTTWPHRKCERGTARLPIACVQDAAAASVSASSSAVAAPPALSSPLRGRPQLQLQPGSPLPSQGVGAVRVLLATAYAGPALHEAASVSVLQAAPPTLDPPPPAALAGVRCALLGAVLPVPLARVQLGGVSYELRAAGGERGASGAVGCLRVGGGTAWSAGARAPAGAGGAPPAAGARPAGGARGPRVGGCAGAQALLRELLAGALLHPGAFEALGLRPPRGALLTGPPGVGKTLLARAACAALGGRVRLLAVSGPALMSGVVGESEARVARLFREAAACAAGAVILIDDIEGLCPRREAGGASETDARVVAALLACMDGIGEGEGARGGGGASGGGARGGGERRGPASAPRVFVLAATSRPGLLDPALRRPGRLDREIALPVPSAAERADILRVCLAPYPLGEGLRKAPRGREGAVDSGASHPLRRGRAQRRSRRWPSRSMRSRTRRRSRRWRSRCMASWGRTSPHWRARRRSSPCAGAPRRPRRRRRRRRGAEAAATRASREKRRRGSALRCRTCRCPLRRLRATPAAWTLRLGAWRCRLAAAAEAAEAVAAAAATSVGLPADLSSRLPPLP